MTTDFNRPCSSGFPAVVVQGGGTGRHRSPPPAPTLPGKARAAIRAATLAVEHRLDDFSGPEGYAEDIAADEPRLLPELEKLEETIARLLVESWSVKPAEAQPTPDFLSRLLRLATHMRHVASLEFDLVHEAMNKPGGVD
jgi:hypothetical protein